jgi:DNA polymerase-3 subunit delta
MELEYAKIAAKGFPQPIARVYLFGGSDDALKREAVQKLTAPLLDDAMADFDREERDAPSGGGGGDADFARQILASAAGMPMLSERRVVIVTNVHRLGKEDQDTLAVGLSHLGDRSLLVLIAGAPEYDAGKVKGRSTVGAKLTAAVAKAGHIILCDAPGEGDLSARAKALVKSRGKTIEPDALRRLMDRAKAVAADRGGGGKGGDLNVLVNELEKALAYVGGRPTVTLADAAAVSLQSAEENIFALLDAVGSRDVKRALWEVEEMLRVGDKPDGVAARTFVMLARHLRQLWAAKYLAEKRLSGDRLPPEVQALLSGEMLGITQRQSYRLRGLQQQARGWDFPKLRRALARTLASDMAMKGIAPVRALGVNAPGDDPASNLRLLVVDLCG